VKCQEKWTVAVRRICSVEICWLFAKDVWGCWGLKIQGWSSTVLLEERMSLWLVAERLEGEPYHLITAKNIKP